MEIPRSLLSELTDAVNALSASAQALAATALDDIFKEWDGSDVAGLRVECIEALEAIESAYCDAFAAGRAAEFYEACRAAQGVRGAYSAIADSRRDPQALAGAVRAMVQYVVNGDTDRYRRECLSRIDADVRRSANSCVAYNTRRDPKKPRYARVPAGAETCGFCLMLSSFGFHYTTEEAARHAHDGCDCRVVPSFSRASVEGYDPDGMYSRYQNVLETLGGRDGIRAEWDALPREERDAYIASHGKKEGAAFQKYMNKRVSQEIEANGAVWFQEGDETPAGRLSKAMAAKRAPTGRPVTASHATLMKGLPSGRPGQTLKDAACDVYTTSDGISLVFPQGMDAAKQAMTPNRALGLLDKVPGEVRDKMQREVYFVDYENPQDAYWRKRYKNFTSSYATGGEEITFYASASHDDDYVVRTYCHEAGHYIDAKNGTKKSRASDLTKWKRAMNDDLAFSGLAHPTRYAANANTEDFAESLAEYCMDGVSFRKNFPNRAAVLDGILAKKGAV